MFVVVCVVVFVVVCDVLCVVVLVSVLASLPTLSVRQLHYLLVVVHYEFLTRFL